MKDAILRHALITNPIVLKVIEAFPTAIPRIAILTLLSHGLFKCYNAVVLPPLQKESSTSVVTVSPITTRDNEFTATFTPIHFSDDESIVVTDIAADAEYTTMPVPAETTTEDKSFEVNVTKISAVLDRFESKILSLVGGTRFHPSPSITEEEMGNKKVDIVSEIDTLDTIATDIDLTTSNTSFEVIEVCDDKLVDVAHQDQNQLDCSDASNHLSLKSYEITLPSSESTSLWSTLTTPSSKAAVRAFGVIASALFSVNVLPPIVRHVVTVFAAIFILGLLVQEIRGAFSNRNNADALDSLIHDIEARTLSYKSEMEPLVVASQNEEIKASSSVLSSLRFWRTRLPILDGVANMSSELVLTQGNLNDENVGEYMTGELEEDVAPQVEPAVEYFDAAPVETTSPTSKSVWRWMTPVYSQPKMTRTACTAIVGM
jgi:hypothetical protein